jgi:hypothetical protein
MILKELLEAPALVPASDPFNKFLVSRSPLPRGANFI